VDLTGWPDDLIGEVNATYGPGLVATDDGSLWLIAHDADERDALARFDGRGWDFIAIPSLVSDVLQLLSGPDGSIWVFARGGESMARYTDGAWTVVETPPGIRPGVYFNTEDALRPVVTSAGAVWIGRKGNTDRLSQTGCDGLLRYDGTWTGYLADHCVHSVAAGPRGEAWVVAGPIDDFSGMPVNTEVYLIDPRTSAGAGE
jgi:hypothetical protein